MVVPAVYVGNTATCQPNAAGAAELSKRAVWYAKEGYGNLTGRVLNLTARPDPIAAIVTLANTNTAAGEGTCDTIHALVRLSFTPAINDSCTRSIRDLQTAYLFCADMQEVCEILLLTENLQHR